MIRLFRHYISQALLTLLIAEALNLFWAIYLGRTLRMVQDYGRAWPHLGEVAPNALVFTAVMITIMVALGLYERHFWRGKGDMLLRVVISFLLGLFVMTNIYYLFPDLYLGRGEFILAFAISFMGVLLLRFVFFQVTNHNLIKRRVLVLGVGQHAAQIEELQEHPATAALSFRVMGYVRVHEDEARLVPEGRAIQVTDTLYDLTEKLRVDEIVTAMDDRRKGFPVDEILECKMQGVMVSSFLNFFERESGKIALDALRPSNFIFADGLHGVLHKRFAKRVFDLIASLVLLALTWPIMLLATLAVWLESGGRGPILYRQIRVGRKEHLFEVIKFRSMRVDAEKDGKAVWAGQNDSRITRVGAVLRETRIDELPQLFNVLWGQMSFVGPRPERPQFVTDLCKKIPFYTMRHMVKPGITGWAQICYPYGASEDDAREKLRYDLYYIKNYSFFFDVVILLQTVHTVIWGKGAH
ncbi:MAG: TIGR03013 family PEP-CTERM/XrtA system glycosyltransferase [Candidatus Competibacter sp.]|nr:TIGR03013 family PEP-CTERM/XrtA system glycosyltransferase [Candidatus Competibacter sp.]MDG4606148.1 TIGR03013 family PEP-CTERM/XrtA system glycosyltransferase [Candidatus Contendobacter sp.]HRD50536.1 TIGR03013 family PEP-CTERM/XrtA system glycosyltransferase [Candidatus Contendobacter sp.]